MTRSRVLLSLNESQQSLDGVELYLEKVETILDEF